MRQLDSFYFDQLIIKEHPPYIRMDLPGMPYMLVTLVRLKCPPKSVVGLEWEHTRFSDLHPSILAPHYTMIRNYTLLKQFKPILKSIAKWRAKGLTESARVSSQKE